MNSNSFSVCVTSKRKRIQTKRKPQQSFQEIDCRGFSVSSNFPISFSFLRLENELSKQETDRDRCNQADDAGEEEWVVDYKGTVPLSVHE